MYIELSKNPEEQHGVPPSDEDGGIIAFSKTGSSSFWTAGSASEINRADLLHKLSQVVLEAYEDGWDGYNALKIRPNSIGYSLQFISLLPPNFLNPDVAIDADGEVAFEWGRHPRETISLRIGASGGIKYASLLGYTPKYGTIYLSYKVPEDLTGEISKFIYELE